MFKNYVIIAFRSLKRHKIYSFITITGLTLGMAVFLLTTVWVLHELSFDRFHENASSIYRVSEKRYFPDQVQLNFRTPGPLSHRLKEDFPEIHKSVRVAMTGERVLQSGQKKFYEDWILTVDPEFFALFSFAFIEGDRYSALDNPNAIVITKQIAEKYFGKENPIGKILTMDGRLDFTVTGLIKDVPSNSHLQFDMVVPFDIVEKLGWETDAWDFSMALTYIQLDDSVDHRVFEKKIAGLVKNYDQKSNIELYLKPLTKIYLFSSYDKPDAQGRIQYVTVFSLLGVLILIVACINFMNLATARSEYRSREIGMRKVIGASKAHIIRQFLVEAMCIAFLSLLLTPLLIQIVLPGFNRITGGTFAFPDFLSVTMIFVVLGGTLFTGILSGSYPAFFLSSYQPVIVFKKSSSSGHRGAFLRKSLVLVQLSISLILLILSAVIYGQIDFLKNKDLGLNKEHVVSIPLGIANEENSQIYKRFKNEITNAYAVENVTAAFTHPTSFGTRAKDVVFEGKKLDEKMPINITSVDFDFIETLKIQVLEGRSFAERYGAERNNLIINERLKTILGEGSALNKTLEIGSDYKGNIIGVVKDFHLESVSNSQIGPLILFLNPGINYIFVRIHPDDVSATLERLEQAWMKIAPNLPFSYSFLDEEFNQLYTDVENLGTILRYFTIIAGFIACLGLFALSSFAAERRTKEIGIRKVLGSSVGDILILLNKDFLELILIANLIAWPISWVLLESWLENFPYRVSISLSTFALAGLLILFVTLATVSFQTLKASLANPSRSLRYE
ncbi:MAG: ABC transporter permease [Candidatus Aminicenantes bacterium]|nr:MAG: ABC transporter permease [Candidatus Aminicenantes bacterium]